MGTTNEIQIQLNTNDRVNIWQAEDSSWSFCFSGTTEGGIEYENDDQTDFESAWDALEGAVDYLETMDLQDYL